MLQITVVGSGLKQLENAAKVLGSSGRARVAYSRAINHTGRIAQTAAGRALSDQTGLPKSTGKRAVSRKVDRSKPATLTFTINASGGPISLKYFKPRETHKGVTAAPFNQRQLYPRTFMKAGWWPKRVSKPGWNKQVFERATSDGYGFARDPSTMKLQRTVTKFKKKKSDVIIPHEVVRGVTAQAFRQATTRLTPRVEHEIMYLTKRVFSRS